MNPHSKPRPLFFTPRSPWGRLPQKHAHQSHMRASEDKKPVPKIAGNNVPGSLESQITPERAGEIMHPSPQPPLSAKPKPSLKDEPYSPPAQQPSTAATAPGAARPPATVQGQPTLSPSQADKTWEKKAPEKNWWDTPLNFNGIEAVPSVNPHGASLELRVQWEKFLKK